MIIPDPQSLKYKGEKEAPAAVTLMVSVIYKEEEEKKKHFVPTAKNSLFFCCCHHHHFSRRLNIISVLLYRVLSAFLVGATPFDRWNIIMSTKKRRDLTHRIVQKTQSAAAQPKLHLCSP